MRPGDRERSSRRFLKGEGEFEGERENPFPKRFPSPPSRKPAALPGDGRQGEGEGAGRPEAEKRKCSLVTPKPSSYPVSIGPQRAIFI